ncbi:uncharacterized protein L199_007443 [Kwoniella botswanensis]|uniref:uncharacterized protein n=1 Tax=Kwoniella botswanensis TaxID=1268659 RepID=UPI00315C6FE7
MHELTCLSYRLQLETLIPILLPEVLSHILLFLNISHRSDLASCARVSKRFNQAATPILYRHVVLHPDQDLGMIFPQFSVEGTNRRKDLLKHVQIITIGDGRDRYFWSLSELCEGWKSPGLDTIRVACGYHPPPYALSSMVNILKPTKIIIETGVEEVLNRLHLTLHRSLVFLDNLKERVTVIFEMGIEFYCIPSELTSPQDFVYPRDFSLPKIDQVKKLAWIFPPGREDLYEAKYAYLIKTSILLSLDAEMILVHRSENINQHSDGKIMRCHEDLDSGSTKSITQTLLLKAVHSTTRLIDEISKGMSIGDYIEKTASELWYPDDDDHSPTRS